MKFKNKRKIILIIGIFILMASIIISVFVLIPPEANDKKTKTQNPAIQNPIIQNVEPSKTPSTYGNLMKSFNENVPEFYYHYKDIDGNGVSELLILENCALYIYTCDDNGVRQVGSHDFVTGTVRMFSSQNSKYPGIFCFTVGGGCDHYGYLTLNGDNIVTTPLCEYYYSADEPYWVDISDDKEMIAEAKALYNENKDIVFLDFEPVTNTKNSATFVNGAKWYTATVLFDEANLSAKSLVITDCDTNKEIQKISLNRSEEVTTTNKNIYALDVNFDGYLDLLIPDMHPARAIFFSAYIYDSAQQKFVEAPSFKDIPNFALDTQNKQILCYSGGDSMFNYGVACYDKDKKDFVTTNSILIEPNYTGGTTEFSEYHFEECRYEDGKEIIVNEFNIPFHEFHLYPVAYPDILPYYQQGSFWNLYSDKWDGLFKNENGVLCIDDDSILKLNLSLQEVKTIFEPLLNKAIEVEQAIINDAATFEYEDKIAFRQNDSDYSLITDKDFQSLDAVWNYAYTAFTPEAAQRAFKTRLDQSLTPRFLEKDGKLYYNRNAHSYKSKFDMESIEIVDQLEDSIIVGIKNYGYDKDNPDTCFFIMTNTQNGWRLATTETESYKINADNYLLKLVAENKNQQPAIDAFTSFLNGKASAKDVTPNKPSQSKDYIYISDLNCRNITLSGIDAFTLFDLNDDDIPELVTDGYTMDVFSYDNGELKMIYSSPAGSSSLKYLLASKKIYWSLSTIGVSYEIASFDKDLNVTVDTYFDGKTEQVGDEEIFYYNENKISESKFYKLMSEFMAPHFFESPDTVWYAYNTPNNSFSMSRDIDEMQPETTEIITMDGKCYQSYVASNVDIRYIWVSKEEHEMSATWNWVPVGTQKFYSLLLLGKVNEGRQ